ncbi:MAG TPA: histidine--tRNA ligase, partial [Methanocellales archaeon]|nr:histidine--tRNA ligase [Methanocellales archaeon]
MKIQRPRGTQDFLPQEMAKRRFIENKMRKTVESWGYQEIQTPIFESLDLFTLRSGDTIIDQSYIFDDKGGRKLILRPELTEPVTRLYVEKLQVDPKPLKLYYFSNCF